MDHILLVLVIMAHLFLITNAAASYSDQGDALIAFKTKLNDVNNRLESWKLEEDPCRNWQYVTCNKENNVVMVDLHNFSFSGQLVPELGQLTYLKVLQLSGNNITGRIPDELGNLPNIRTLDLSFNRLNGEIPSSLGNLRTLIHLFLNNNTLTGSVPVSLSAISRLEMFDISNNSLSGDILLNGSFSHIPSSSFAGNPNLRVGGATHEAPMIPGSPSPSVWRHTKTYFAIGATLGVFLLAVGLAFCCYCCRKPEDRFYDVPAKEDLQLGQLKKFNFKELLVATENFDPKLITGNGETSKVYKGRLQDGKSVAVKRLKPGPNESRFETEVAVIGNAIHSNVLELIGFCTTATERLLVYPFMENGSVMSCLKERHGTLDWPKRWEIALACAKGLAYLHEECDPKIIHRDVKAENILLNGNFEASIGDFGLGKNMEYNATHVSSKVRGTLEHISPEYLATGKASVKTDIFGYGMTLLQIISGRHDVLGLANEHYDVYNWVDGILKENTLEQLVDTRLNGKYVEDQMRELIEVALLCIRDNPVDRPTMSKVVRRLEGGDGLENIWRARSKAQEEAQEAQAETSRLEFSNVLDVLEINEEDFPDDDPDGSSSHISIPIE